MNFLSHWFQYSDDNNQKPQKLPVHAATHVTAKELIALQQYANKLDMSRRSNASSSTTGTHPSSFRGRGMDYQESRIYQAGDDIRNMDWRVTARAGKPHTKLYQEERERPVVLLVDLNPGMFFGSVKSLKSVLAARTATLIAWAVAARGDRIGALIINASHHELPPKTGKRGVLQLIRELVTHADPLQGLHNEFSHSSLNDELKRLRRLTRPGSLVFIISDFYNINQKTASHLQRISQHNDIQAIQIVDPLEITPPPPERYTVTDGEHTGILNTRSKKERMHYQHFFNLHHQKLQQLMNQGGIPLLQFSTADDLILNMQQSFGKQKKQSSTRSRVA